MRVELAGFLAVCLFGSFLCVFVFQAQQKGYGELSASASASATWKPKFCFCTMLDECKLDLAKARGMIPDLKGMEKEHFLESKIDVFASMLFQALNKHRVSLDENSVIRYSCYMTVTGQNNLSGITQNILVDLDETNYFPELEFSVKAVLPRKKYRFAFLLLVHKEAQRVLMLLKALYSQKDVFAIHVDKKNPALFEILRIAIPGIFPAADNIFIFTQVEVVWAGSSIVFAQQFGMFRLLDAADWEYFINLSADDYPMISLDEVYCWIKQQPKASFIRHYRADSYLFNHRFRTPRFLSGDRLTAVGISDWPRRELPEEMRNYTVWFNSQWVILERVLCELFRIDRVAIRSLAFFEHTVVPDESYFAFLALNNPTFSSLRITNQFMRFITWGNNGNHPNMLTVADIPSLNRSQAFFARKIDAVTQTSLVTWLQRRIETYRPYCPNN